MVGFRQDIKDAKKTLTELQARKRILQERLEQAKDNLGTQEKLLLDSEKARTVAQTVATILQSNLEFRITNIVTMALASVFSDPYEFKVKFVERRNQTECDMLFVRDGNEFDPLESVGASGGGAIDIASLALRMAVWSIKKTRAIQILDEPAKFLSRDMQEKASEMLKKLSEELEIQMVIVSHIPEMITAADRVINVENENGYAKVKIL